MLGSQWDPNVRFGCRTRANAALVNWRSGFAYCDPSFMDEARVDAASIPADELIESDPRSA